MHCRRQVASSRSGKPKAVSAYLAPIAYALFLWWFATGAILFLDGLPRRTYGFSMAGATVMLVAGLVGLAWTGTQDSVSAVYGAFTSALAVWAFIEMSFLMGFVTGTRTRPCHAHCSGLAHMGHAIGAIIWHELLIVAAAAVIALLTWGAENQVGFWTFMILWGMRASAKLNLHFGVRNLGESLLPPHLAYLKSFLRKRSMNAFFPVSITISTIIATAMGLALVEATDAAQIAGTMLLLTLLVLAIVEHWFLVLPLPVDAIWNWSRSGVGATQLGAKAPVAPVKIHVE
ncbi:conserved membrane hypothetical protein [Rhizobium sp. EC-SD404]|nr:conserved membrane hypothetical protein [Rhizobium sp. EC-SD404]